MKNVIGTDPHASGQPSRPADRLPPQGRGTPHPLRRCLSLVIPALASLLSGCPSGSTHPLPPSGTPSHAPRHAIRESRRPDPADRAVAYPLDVRQPAGAGTFYPADPLALRNALDPITRPVPLPEVPGWTKVYLAPWGTLEAAGQEIARVLLTIRRQEDVHTVILLGEAHHAEFEGASVWSSGGYATPATVTPVNALLGSRLRREAGFGFVPEAHARETSLEMQVLLMQRILPEARIVPVLISPVSNEERARIAATLARYVRVDGVVLLVAGNLSVGMEDPSMAGRIDQHTMTAIGTLDPVRIDAARRRIRNEAAPNLQVDALDTPNALLCAVDVADRLGMDSVTVLGYTTNWEVPGTPTLYGMAGAAFHARGRHRPLIPAPRPDLPDQAPDRTLTPDAADVPYLTRMPLSIPARRELLDATRTALEAAVVHARYEPPYPDHPELRHRQAVFVTLYRPDGTPFATRGHLKPDRPLYEVTADLIRAAATEHGTPTPGIRAGQISPFAIFLPGRMVPVGDWSQVRAGREGVMVERGDRRAVILPEEAVQHGWDTPSLLMEACRRAGLDPDAFRSHSCNLYVFPVTEIRSDAGRTVPARSSNRSR